MITTNFQPNRFYKYEGENNKPASYIKSYLKTSNSPEWAEDSENYYYLNAVNVLLTSARVEVSQGYMQISKYDIPLTYGIRLYCEISESEFLEAYNQAMDVLKNI